MSQELVALLVRMACSWVTAHRRVCVVEGNGVRVCRENGDIWCVSSPNVLLIY